MKRYLYLFLTIILFGNHVRIYSQEEFFGNHDGLSMFYLVGLNENAHATGISAYLKKGIIIGLGYESADNIEFPLFSFLICPSWKLDSGYYKFGFGASYSKYEDYHIIGFTTGVVGGIFKESKFPFSINFSFSPQIIISKNKSSYSSEKSFVPIVSFGITQAFFAKNNAYPYIGISNAYETINKENLFSAYIGINIKIN